MSIGVSFVRTTFVLDRSVSRSIDVLSGRQIELVRALPSPATAAAAELDTAGPAETAEADEHGEQDAKCGDHNQNQDGTVRVATSESAHMADLFERIVHRLPEAAPAARIFVALEDGRVDDRLKHAIVVVPFVRAGVVRQTLATVAIVLRTVCLVVCGTEVERRSGMRRGRWRSVAISPTFCTGQADQGEQGQAEAEPRTTRVRHCGTCGSV
jgi:hypothetical protein